MPRKSHGSDESRLVRRQSARIAAVQTASPAKTPVVKSPKMKRQSTEPKPVSDETESQQSQLKSESSVDDVNGVESTSSSKDVESVSDTHDLPVKRAKIEAVPGKKVEDPIKGKTETEDFEVIDKDMVPAADSIEVKSAIAAQGEEGGLLVDFVQVSKDELPTVEMAKEQPVPVSKGDLQTTESTDKVAEVLPADDISKTEHSEEKLHVKTDSNTELDSSINGQHLQSSNPENSDQPEASDECQVTKTGLTEDTPMETAPAAGDSTPSTDQIPTSVTE